MFYRFANGGVYACTWPKLSIRIERSIPFHCMNNPRAFRRAPAFTMFGHSHHAIAITAHFHRSIVSKGVQAMPRGIR